MHSIIEYRIKSRSRLNGDNNMTYTLACKDTGVDCPYVARGETEEEMMKNAVGHVKEVHGYSD